MNFLRQLGAPVSQPQQQQSAPPPQIGTGTAKAALHTDSALNQISLEYSYPDLQAATSNFAEAKKLGAGSYGGVFQGLLKDGTEVGVKVLDVPDEAGFEEEVKVLSKFRHPNLVILMGFARNNAQRCLVYELLGGGDVHRRLQRSCVENVAFPWRQRVSIALDAACGLSHLHHSSPKVFHRDIKSPNILLDKNGTAKMADFGLACLSHASAHRVKQASGTVGYACPLYVQRGVVTEGSEVYSFGMVLLELLTASPPAYVGSSGGSRQIQYLAHHINGDLRKCLSLADAKAQWPPKACRAIAELALMCSHVQEETRPNFAEIVRTCRSIHDGSAFPSAPVVPKQAPAAGQKPPQVATPGVVGNPPSQGMQLLHHGPGRPLVGSPPRAGSPHLGPPRPGASGVPGVPLVGNPFNTPFPGASAPAPQGAHSPTHGQPQPGGAGQGRCASPSPGQRYGSPVPHGAPPPPRMQHQQLPAQALAPGNVSIGGPQPLVTQPPGTLLQRGAGNFSVGGGVGSHGAPVGEALAPMLFTLECIFSEGVNLHEVPRNILVLQHRLGPENTLDTPLRIGRVFQSTLFDDLVLDDQARSTISREHFQVWAEVAETQIGRAGSSCCNFFLENLSGNGTHVNDDYLQVRGEQCEIRNGDIIALSRSATCPRDGAYQALFLQFRFHLSDSCLREADSLPCSASSGSVRSDDDLFVEDVRLDGQIAGMYVEGGTVFVLEVHGPACFDQVPTERRRIAYSEDPSTGHESQLYSSLIVGRAHQLDFWQQVLHSDAFNTLSRQHFEVQTWRTSMPSEGLPRGRVAFSFLVRNLSDINPIYVQSGPEGPVVFDPSASTLAKGEQRHLLDGDKIVMNINQDHTFWLIFRDLTKSTSLIERDEEMLQDSETRGGLAEVVAR